MGGGYGREGGGGWLPIPPHVSTSSRLRLLSPSHHPPPKASHEYGDLKVQVSMTSKPQELLKCVAEQGFYQLSASYLKDVCDALEWEYSSTTLASLLQSMTKKIWPGCGLEKVEAVLSARLSNIDTVDGLEDILGLEWVTELFDRSTAEEVCEEIRTAKTMKAARSEFKGDLDRLKDRGRSLLGRNRFVAHLPPPSHRLPALL